MSKSDVFPVGGIAFCGSCATLRKVYPIAVHDDLRGVGSSSIVFVSPNPEGIEERFQSCFAGAGGRCILPYSVGTAESDSHVWLRLRCLWFILF